MTRTFHGFIALRPIPELRKGGILPPSPVLAPGSALGSRPRVALSSAQVASVYRTALWPGKGSRLGLGPLPRFDHHPLAPPWGPERHHPAEFHTGVMWATNWRERNGLGFPAHAGAAERSVDLVPGGARAFGCHGCFPYISIYDYTCFFSSRTSMSRYCCTRARLHWSM